MNPDPTFGDVATDSSFRTFIPPKILAALSHLDLSGRIIFRETRNIGGGSFGDILKSKCTFDYGSDMEVAVKRLRFHLPEDIKGVRS